MDASNTAFRELQRHLDKVPTGYCPRCQGPTTWLEVDGGGAVLPGALEPVADAAVIEEHESLLGDGGTGQVATEALDLGVVGAVEGTGGVHIEPLHDGDGLVGSSEMIS